MRTLTIIKRSPPDFRDGLRRQIKGALRAAIEAHGPVTLDLIGSVLKRLETQPEYRRLLDE